MSRLTILLQPAVLVPDSRLWVSLQVQVPAERVTCMAFSPDGNCLAAITWGGCPFLYNRQHTSKIAVNGATAQKKPDILVARTDTQRQPRSDAQMLDHGRAVGEPWSAGDGARGDQEENLACQPGAAQEEQAADLPAAKGAWASAEPPVQSHSCQPDNRGGEQAVEERLAATCRDSVASKPAALAPMVSAANSTAVPEETVSRLAWIDHGLRGRQTCQA